MHIVFQHVYGPVGIHMFIVMQRLELLFEQGLSGSSTLSKLGEDFFSGREGVKRFSPELCRGSEICSL